LVPQGASNLRLNQRQLSASQLEKLNVGSVGGLRCFVLEYATDIDLIASSQPITRLPKSVLLMGRRVHQPFGTAGPGQRQGQGYGESWHSIGRGHVKAPWSVYRSYLDPEWRNTYDDWARAAEARPDFCHTGFGANSHWDTNKRVADLETQGVVAEVVFPNGTPFTKSDSIEQTRAGIRPPPRTQSGLWCD
jgi:hypothetical protein